MIQLFFALEHNLHPLQPLLRALGHSAFITSEKEIDVPMHAPDSAIITRIAEQKENLGIDRIVITRDYEFVSSIGAVPIKVIVLIDKVSNYNLSKMKKKQLAAAIILVAEEMLKKTSGQLVSYLDCSQFY